jgi:5-methyltetrahydrofolate corrinoid/iron sulfur protein methyltransferase
MGVNYKIVTIAESINIMSKTIGPAIKERNPKPIQQMAEEEIAAGATMLDLNLGPARKAGDEMMEWLVKTVQEVDPKVGDEIPLALDTTNTTAIEAGLKVVRNPETALLNSISAQPESLDERMPLVQKYNCNFVALTLSEEGIPRDVNERGECAGKIYAKALEFGIPESKMWIDPIVLPVSVSLNQVIAFLEFLPMIPDFAPGALSTCGLSNVSNGAPTELRPKLNGPYQAMHMVLGIHSSIVDAYDKDMMALCKGERPNLVDLAGRFMAHELDEETFPTISHYIESQTDYKNQPKINPKELSGIELEYYKSFLVLTGKVLYSHSWLEMDV